MNSKTTKGQMTESTSSRRQRKENKDNQRKMFTNEDLGNQFNLPQHHKKLQITNKKTNKIVYVEKEQAPAKRYVEKEKKTVQDIEMQSQALLKQKDWLKDVFQAKRPQNRNKYISNYNCETLEKSWNDNINIETKKQSQYHRQEQNKNKVFQKHQSIKKINLDIRPDRVRSKSKTNLTKREGNIFRQRHPQTEDDLKDNTIQMFYLQLSKHNLRCSKEQASLLPANNLKYFYGLEVQKNIQDSIGQSQDQFMLLSRKKDEAFEMQDIHDQLSQLQSESINADNSTECIKRIIRLQENTNESSDGSLDDNFLSENDEPGNQTKINQHVENIYGCNDNSFDEGQYDCFDKQTQEHISIEQFILDNQKKLKRYKLKKSIKMHERFLTIEQYQRNLRQLNKYQIIRHVNQTIQMISQQTCQREIKITVSQELIEDKKKKLMKQCICVHPYDRQNNEEQNKYALQQSVDRGKILGIITYDIPFQMKQLDQGKASLCFIEKKNEKILLTGIEDSGNIPNQPLYFINLDSIITHLRQYQAILAVDSCNLSNQIIGNKNYNSHDKGRLYLLQTEIFRQIKSRRNQAQVAVIKKISINKEGIFLIQGPPGTGKTETIANMVSLQYFHFQKNKQTKLIVICAQSNAAVNHIGRKLLREGLIGSSKKPNILRLGSTSQYDEDLLTINLSHQAEIQLLKNHSLYDEYQDNLSAKLRSQKQSILQRIFKLTSQKKFGHQFKELKKKLRQIISKLAAIHKVISEFYEEYQSILEQILMRGEIILSTLNTCGKWKFLKHLKDHVGCLIIDEAGQATQPSTLIPMQCNADKVILVGDHKQLKPTVMSKNGDLTGYSTSLLERLIKAGLPCKMLDTQYRMIPLLRQFPSKQFYSNQLKDGRQHKIPESLAKINKPCLFFNLSFGGEEIFKKSYQNVAQAEGVFFLMQKLIRNDPNITIGVIAPYKSQVKLIQNLFEEANYPEKVMKNVKISTVDAFQGQQMDVILISCVRSNKNRSIGFVKDDKRMNVSLTRAKYCLFVFGDSDTLSSSKHWEHYINFHKSKGSLINTSHKDKLIHALRTQI